MKSIYKPWKPRSGARVMGHRVLVVGYSHYISSAAEEADPALTQKVVERVIAGEDNHAFWTSIMRYFGAHDRGAFWASIGFMNYVPRAIGNEGDKYRTAQPLELEGAADRLLHAMEDQPADVAFVFSSKAAGSFKRAIGSRSHSISQLELPRDDDSIRRDYVFEEVRMPDGGAERRVILAGHPQGAHQGTMRAMVQVVLSGLPDAERPR